MRITYQIPETYEAISRPVAYDLTRSVGALMHFPASTKILFTGSSPSAPQTGSTLNYEGAPSAFPGTSRIDVTMAEDSDDTGVFTETPLQNNAPMVFEDCRLGVRLRVNYASTVLSVSFNIRSHSRVEAEQIRDEFRVRYAGGRQQNLHALRYSYAIPDYQWKLLEVIYRMREAVDGYGDSFDDWIKAHASSRLTYLSSLTGGSSLPSFLEQQVGVQGYFDFQVQPEAPDKSDPDGSYSFPIAYKIRYDKPTSMSMDYPLVVHNQMLPEPYHGPRHAHGSIPQPYADPRMYSDQVNQTLRSLFLRASLSPMPIDGIRYPTFDDWIPTSVPLDTTSVYTCITQVDVTNATDVLSLTDLVGIAWDPDVLSYAQHEGAMLGVYRQSALHVALYRDRAWMGDQAITVDGNLHVASTAPMNPRDPYHLRISILTDLLKLTDSARLRLRSQGKACLQIFQALTDALKLAVPLPTLVGGGVVTQHDFLVFAEVINRALKPHKGGLECGMLTVSFLMVSAKPVSA